MNETRQLGGGYSESNPIPFPTVNAVLSAVKPGSASSTLVVISGPPGVGKSTLAHHMLDLVPGSLVVDKDCFAAPFILELAQQTGTSAENAYGTDLYWKRLRPIEYSGAVAIASANLVNSRTVFLVGGWGPELGIQDFWISWKNKISPAALIVIHLDPPEIEKWRTRMAIRGSRTDSPWFESFCESVGNLPVWKHAVRIASDCLPHEIAEQTLASIQQD